MNLANYVVWWHVPPPSCQWSWALVCQLGASCGLRSAYILALHVSARFSAMLLMQHCLLVGPNCLSPPPPPLLYATATCGCKHVTVGVTTRVFDGVITWLTYHSVSTRSAPPVCEDSYAICALFTCGLCTCNTHALLPATVHNAHLS